MAMRKKQGLRGVLLLVDTEYLINAYVSYIFFADANVVS